ncbi:hypothetical protein HanHA300_Chr07g0246781 [Helianthus annuus]|nr:hypothetical protein HanHA300_Chr07g0246781 [Helianthus annuus]KAJ0557331.1 hypothetical protein HanIR_Chr07g0323981 [Helianthus annuus]KAJ0728854.1 hypothetical protein HanLR1_Chr07g0246431 [Helianthus annuus]KAJ0905143.1 hypothetical protein HanPSC8_Chr07g0290591 [Helianthus annuus]
MQGIYNMNGSKDDTSSGGGRGGGCSVGSGLCGGKTKQAAGKRTDCGIVIREPDFSRRDGDAVSRRPRSQGLDPKHPNGKATIEKPTICTKGPYVMVRPPRGPSITYRRGTTGSYSRVGTTGSSSRVGEGDPMADLAGTLQKLSPNILDNVDGSTLQDLSRDILDDGDNDDDAGDDGDVGDDGGSDNGEDFEGGGDGDGRQFIQSNGKKYVSSF